MQQDDKREIRLVKRHLKQVGNQQRRCREKRALKDLTEGKLDFIPDFRYDKPTEDLNGFDKNKKGADYI